MGVRLAAVLLLGAAFTAPANAAEKYVWHGWKMTAADYAIVHAVSGKPSENDFYLVCRGGRDLIDLSIRGLARGGYGDSSEPEAKTTFVFGKARLTRTAVSRGPAEMLGGISISYALPRNDAVLAHMARGEPFRVVLPKATTQLFVPKGARRYFKDMAAHCKR